MRARGPLKEGRDVGEVEERRQGRGHRGPDWLACRLCWGSGSQSNRALIWGGAGRAPRGSRGWLFQGSLIINNSDRVWLTGRKNKLIGSRCHGIKGKADLGLEKGRNKGSAADPRSGDEGQSPLLEHICPATFRSLGHSAKDSIAPVRYSDGLSLSHVLTS